MLSTFLTLGLATSLGMAVLWLYATLTSNATIVDLGWTLGLLGTGLLLFFSHEDRMSQTLIATCALTIIWASRLTMYLYVKRILKHTNEDGRYQRMRKTMGRWAHPGFFIFFQLQAGFVLLFALPIYAAAANPHEQMIIIVIGIVIGLGATIGEAIADAQLDVHRRDPAMRGKTCRTGLWRYSRHPNYFFEICHWCAYPILAIGSELWWLALLGPLFMFLFIWKITGIPHTEKQALSHRPDYADYQCTTNMLIPWFPRKSRSGSSAETNPPSSITHNQETTL